MPTILETAEQICFRCHDCGEIEHVRQNGGTGYAVLSEKDSVICYPCADEREREFLTNNERFTGYISEDGRTLTTWTGGYLGKVLIGERHPWSRERHYVTVETYDGSVWHGTGAPGQWCSIRRSKSKN
jgi:hypothetical protein